MTEHRGLHRDHQFARFDAERGKAKDLVAILRDQHLHHAAWLGNRPRAQNFGHGQSGHAIFDALATRLDLVYPDSRQLWIGEHAGRDQPLGRGPPPALQVVVNDEKVVDGYVSKMRAAGTFAHRPDVLASRQEVLVRFDVAVSIELHADLFQVESL